MASFDLAKVRVAGSAEEVREVGVNPAKVYCCGPERPGVKQCPLYEACDRPEKDKVGFVRWMKGGQEVIPQGPSYANLEGAVREGPGPLNLGIRRTKILAPGRFRVVNATCACWEYPYQRKKHLSVNEGGEQQVAIINVIAIEGETINLPGSLPKLQEDGKTLIHEIQAEGIPTILAPFKRPRQNPDFAASKFAMGEVKREQERERQTNLKDFINLKSQVPDVPDETQPPADLDLGPARGGASSRG